MTAVFFRYSFLLSLASAATFKVQVINRWFLCKVIGVNVFYHFISSVSTINRLNRLFWLNLDKRLRFQSILFFRQSFDRRLSSGYYGRWTVRRCITIIIAVSLRNIFVIGDLRRSCIVRFRNFKIFLIRLIVQLFSPAVFIAEKSVIIKFDGRLCLFYSSLHLTFILR